MEVVSSEKIVLNVGGFRYETYPSTLKAFPGTKLCSLTEPQVSEAFDYDPSTKEFFLDRSAKLFGVVLGYCWTRHLHCPEDICWSALEEELAFWEIPLGQLLPCCWTTLGVPEGPLEECQMKDTKEEEEEEEDCQVLLGQVEGRSGQRWAGRRLQIWSLLEKPFSSRWALGLALLSLLLNIGLIIILCEETFAFANYLNDTASDVPLEELLPLTKYQAMPYLLYLELAIILCFMAEFVLRLTLCPKRKKFLRKLLNVVDFLALLPVLIQLSLRRGLGKELVLAAWLDVFRLLYVFKLLKIFRLVETPLMLRILPYMFRSLLRETLIVLIILAFEVTLSGVLFYYAESFEDLPSSLWWAVITLTTVGYGDLHPITALGQVVAAGTALCGVLTIILPIPIFSIKFKSYYNAAMVKEKMKRRKQPPS